jgi:hypothetical protein
MSADPCASDDEYVQLVRRWADNVWAAYKEQQPIARQWLRAVQQFLVNT